MSAPAKSPHPVSGEPIEYTSPIEVTAPTELSSSEQQTLRGIVFDVEMLDGAEPLNEPALLRLRSSAGPALVHLMARSDDATVGYAQIDIGEPAEAEILVGPVPGRLRLADQLIARAESSVSTSLLIWSRGTSPVHPAAIARGYSADRTLLTMRRSLAGLSAGPVEPPPGVTLRPFQVGTDDDAWLAVNAAAFATHPEQGAWTAADLQERLEQPWFDADGFILAIDDDGRLLGYHWTKVHEPARPGDLPLGEVYVLGISPAAQGRGLGKILLEAGLRYLARGPASDVILYVEATNPSAVHLYERDGFVVDRRDVQLRSPARAGRS
jgi:mycothiol synthase